MSGQVNLAAVGQPQAAAQNNASNSFIPKALTICGIAVITALVAEGEVSLSKFDIQPIAKLLKANNLATTACVGIALLVTLLVGKRLWGKSPAAQVVQQQPPAAANQEAPAPQPSAVAAATRPAAKQEEPEETADLTKLCQKVDGRSRFILLLGQTRTGKSNFKEVMRNPLYTPPEPKMYSSTREPNLEILKMGEGEVCVLDTPGVGDFVEKKGEQLSDEQILKANDQAVRRYFGGYEKVDRVFMTIKLPERYEEDEMRSIRKCAEHLKSKGVTNMTLVLTHSEKFSEQEMKRYLEDAKQVKGFTELLIEFFKEGEEVIFSGGFPYIGDGLWATSSTNAIMRTLDTILGLRKKILEKVWGEASVGIIWDFLNSRYFDAKQKLEQIVELYTRSPDEEGEKIARYTDAQLDAEIDRLVDPYKPQEQRERELAHMRASYLQQQAEAEAKRREQQQAKQAEIEAEVEEIRGTRGPLFQAWERGELPGSPKKAAHGEETAGKLAAAGVNNSNIDPDGQPDGQ